MAKGDTKIFDGVEYESDGTSKEQTADDMKKPATKFKDGEYWLKKVKKPEGFPMMSNGGLVPAVFAKGGPVRNKKTHWR